MLYCTHVGIYIVNGKSNYNLIKGEKNLNCQSPYCNIINIITLGYAVIYLYIIRVPIIMNIE